MKTTPESLQEVRNPSPRLFVVWDPKVDLVLGVAHTLMKAERVKNKNGAHICITAVPKGPFLKAFYANEGIPMLKTAHTK